MEPKEMGASNFRDLRVERNIYSKALSVLHVITAAGESDICANSQSVWNRTSVRYREITVRFQVRQENFIFSETSVS